MRSPKKAGSPDPRHDLGRLHLSGIRLKGHQVVSRGLQCVDLGLAEGECRGRRGRAPRDAAGLPEMTTSQPPLRSFAANLLGCGVDLPTIQALLAHESISMTPRPIDFDEAGIQRM